MSATPATRGAATRDAGADTSRGRRYAAFAGPALIAACVLFALRGFVFQARISDAHPDVLTFWLPRFSFLGRSLAGGHIPLWNPFEMAGYRFAADPQGGWTYLPPMALFSALSPGVAIRSFIVWNPLLAGLGLYGFLRGERLSRVAATAGGLSLAMMMSTSEIAISFPFAGTLAWTPVVLLAAARYRRAERWSRRLAWMALGGLAWSQVANAHLSHGLVVCTVLVAAYLLAGAVADARGREIGAGTAAVQAVMFLAFLPLASLAVVLPRLAFLEASSLGGGYDRLGEALGVLGGGDEIQGNGVWAAWPLAFGVAPGAYAGAAILLAVLPALRARRHRALVWAFGGPLALTWLLLLNAVVAAAWFRSLLLRVPFGDVFLHNPGRLRYLAVVAIPVLGAVGIQGLRDSPMTTGQAAAWLGGGVAVLLVVPLAAGGLPARFAFLAAASAVAAPALWLLATRQTSRATVGVSKAAVGAGAAVGVAGVLTAELLASAVFAHVYAGDTVLTGLEGGEHPNLVAQYLPYPDVDLDAFLRETALAPTIRASQERYLTWAPPAAFFVKGYLFMQEAPDWPALAMERGTLFGLRDALGYNPVQLPRYWRFIRAANDLPIFYNTSVLALPTLEQLRVLGVRYLTVPTGIEPPVPGRVVASSEGYDLLEVDGWQPLISVVASWRVVDGEADALEAVGSTGGGFDPGRQAILETDPGIPMAVATQGGEVLTGRGTYTEVTPEDVRISVEALASSIVVVRTAFDHGWEATVDSKPAPLLPVDAMLLGVAVERGAHEVRLIYRDRDVTAGIYAGMLVWLILVTATSAVWVTERRRWRRPPEGAAGP